MCFIFFFNVCSIFSLHVMQMSYKLLKASLSWAFPSKLQKEFSCWKVNMPLYKCIASSALLECKEDKIRFFLILKSFFCQTSFRMWQKIITKTISCTERFFPSRRPYCINILNWLVTLSRPSLSQENSGWLCFTL